MILQHETALCKIADKMSLKTKKTLKIFLASPSDVNPERETIRTAIAEINRYHSFNDVFIEIFGWEQLSPQMGRPQATINEHLQGCQVFIGILWRSWGSPPDNEGTFSSGFEEEFELAKRLHYENGSPELLLFFKEIDHNQIKDPGQSLAKVINFKKKIEEDRALLYKTFSKLEELATEVRVAINVIISRHLHADNHIPKSPRTPRIASATESSPSYPGSAAPNAMKQIAFLGQILAKSGGLSSIKDLDLSSLVSPEFVKARLMLLVSGLEQVISHEFQPFPIHKHHILYKFSQELHCSEQERSVLFQAMLASDDNVIPGWLWLPDLKDFSFAEYLSIILFQTDSRNLRIRCLEFISLMGFDSIRPKEKRFVWYVLLIADGIEHDQLWPHVVSFIDEQAFSYIEAAGPDNWLYQRRDWLRIWLNCKSSALSFLQSCTDYSLIPIEHSIEMLSAISDLSVEQLSSISRSSNSVLRRAAISELRRRGVSVPKRSSVLMEMLSPLNGVPGLSMIFDAHSMASLLEKSSKDLQEMLMEDSNDRHLAYQLLIERGEISHSQVRSDISSNFERLNADVETHASSARVEKHEEFASFTLAPSLNAKREMDVMRLTNAALAGISIKPEQSDLSLARGLLAKGSNVSACAQIIQSVGQESDVALCVAATKDVADNEKLDLLNAALSLSPSAETLAHELIKSKDKVIRQFGASVIAKYDIAWAREAMFRLLYDSESDVRTFVAILLGEQLSHASLVLLLSRYLNEEIYYYDVVTWLDRFLYAPPALMRFYLEKSPDVLNLRSSSKC